MKAAVDPIGHLSLVIAHWSFVIHFIGKHFCGKDMG
jgi:hypothetical protein